MSALAFHGGTALRFLYGLSRYSEDLDFALESSKVAFSIDDAVERIQSDLAAEAYETRTRIKDTLTVHSAFVRFPGLPHELGLPSQRAQVLSIKIEVDTRPPPGAGLATTLVRRHATLNLQHHDKPSLLAGKLHAILQRPHLKGRDVFDLVWYLADPTWPAPNLELLNHALEQTRWEGPLATPENWRQLVAERLEPADWTKVAADVQPFLERLAETDLLSKPLVLDLLNK